LRIRNPISGKPDMGGRRAGAIYPSRALLRKATSG
jgi:hypothetical protein